MFSLFKSKKGNKDEEENKRLWDNIISIKRKILNKKIATIDDFDELLEAEQKSRWRGESLKGNYKKEEENYLLKNIKVEENDQVNELIINGISFADLINKYTSYTNRSDGNIDTLYKKEIENVINKKPLYEQILFYENNESLYQSKENIEKEKKKIETMNNEEREKYSIKKEEFIKNYKFLKLIAQIYNKNKQKKNPNDEPSGLTELKKEELQAVKDENYVDEKYKFLLQKQKEQISRRSIMDASARKIYSSQNIPLYESIFFAEPKNYDLYKDYYWYDYNGAIELDILEKIEQNFLEKIPKEEKDIYNEKKKKFIEEFIKDNRRVQNLDDGGEKIIDPIVQSQKELLENEESFVEDEKSFLENLKEEFENLSDEQKEEVKQIEIKPLYEQIYFYESFYVDESLYDHSRGPKDGGRLSGSYLNIKGGGNIYKYHLKRAIQAELEHLKQFDEKNDKEGKKAYLKKKEEYNDIKFYEGEMGRINENMNSEFNILLDEQKKEIKEIKTKPLYEQIYFHNQNKYKHRFHLIQVKKEERDFLETKNEEEKIKYEKEKEAYIEGKEKKKRETEEKERICTEYLKNNIFTYHNINPPLNLFESIKDELPQILKQQFEKLSETNNNIQEYLRENKIKDVNDIDKILIFDCVYLYDLILKFNNDTKQLNIDIYNYIGNTFAKSLKILESYAKELDDTIAKYPDPVDFSKFVGADYNTIETNIYKARSTIENKFRKLEDFIKKNNDTAAYSGLTKIFTETKIVIKSSNPGNILSSENTCIYNPKNPRNIYQIIPEDKKFLRGMSMTGDDKSKVFGLSQYNEIIHSDDDTLTKELTNIFRDISKCDSNILIFCSSIDKDVSKVFNGVLTSINKELFNVTIIHETNDSDKIIYMIYNDNDPKNQLIRKITNVFPLGETINIHNSIKDIKHINYKTYEIKSPYGEKNELKYENETKGATAKGQQLDGGSKHGNIFIQFRDTTPPETIKNLDEWWWYKWYFSVPPCASGRLMQISGTCWFNAGLNVVLLSPTISKVLIMKWIELTEEQKKPFMDDNNFDSCFNPKLDKTSTDNSIVEMLFFLIYHILIKNKKITYDKGNISKIPAILVGDIYKSDAGKEVLTNEIINDENRLKNKEFFEKNSKDAEGGDANINIKILLESIIPSIFTQYLCDNKFKLESFTLPNIQKYRSQEYIKELPNILQIRYGELINFKTAPKNINITFNGKEETYELEASTLNVDDSHVISGLICNDIPYIYDSNNVIAVTDWPNNKYNEYLNAVKEQHIKSYAQNTDSVKGMSGVIYIKSSFKKAVEEYDLTSKKVTAEQSSTPPTKTAPEHAPSVEQPTTTTGGHPKRKYTRKVKT